MVLGESEVGYDGLPELPPNWEYNKPDGVDGAPAAAEVPLAAAPPDSSPDQSVVDARTPQEQQCDGGDEKSGQLLLELPPPPPPEKLVSDSEEPPPPPEKLVSDGGDEKSGQLLLELPPPPPEKLVSDSEEPPPPTKNLVSDSEDEKSGQLLHELPPPPEKLVSDSEDEYFHWTPSQGELSDLSCPLCQDVATSLADLETHYHQYHVNPRFLSQIDVKLFKLSNFLVKEIGDPDCESKYPGLYRCHECFNTFSQSSNLKLHLVGHSVEPATVQMAPKTEHHASPPGLANNNITVDINKKKSLHNGSSRRLDR